MRENLIGLGLAAALLGGLFFAASHRAERIAGAGAVNVAAIRAAAESVEPGFVGQKKIGAWELACAAKPVMVLAERKAPQQTGAAEKSPPLPLSLGGAAAAHPPAGGVPASAGAAQPSAGTAAAPPASVSGPAPASTPEKISLGRCRASQAFRRKGASEKDVPLAVNFRIVGSAPGRLGLFVRLPEGKQGETVILRFGGAGLKLPIANCGKVGCVAFAVLAAEGERDLTAAKGAELVLPTGPEGKKIAVRLAFAGLPAALGAIRRAQS